MKAPGGPEPEGASQMFNHRKEQRQQQAQQAQQRQSLVRQAVNNHHRMLAFGPAA